MTDIIQLLPESLANQIAAGEVVQRPASVVKELLENALDAGATQVTLVVKDAGKLLVQVVDNGNGMSETDARMCFERHATSKINSSEDLFNIRTFGFRGEAMASIAAVAQVELKSKRSGDEVGTLIQIEGSSVLRQEPTACAHGTSISVKNLFFNVPARRNFLKSNPVEVRHIIEEFQRVALANPSVGMAMYQSDLETFNLRPGGLPHRIVALFGKAFQEQILPCEEEVSHVKVFGYVGKPAIAKKTRGEQYFFVNGRFIKHPYLNHAVVQAYEGLIPEDAFPFYALFIEIDPRHVDVNVHPTKTEVKFDDERTLYAIVRSAVKQALASQGVAPSLDFGLDVNFGFTPPSPNPQEQPQRQTFPSAGNNYSQGAEINRQSHNLQHWDKLYEGLSKQPPAAAGQASGERPDGSDSGHEVFVSSANQPATRTEGLFGQAVSAPKSKAFQLRQQYIMYQVRSGVMVVDQQAAHERILYDQFVAQLKNGTGVSQRILFPRTIELSPADHALLADIHEDLRALGFMLEDLGGCTVVLGGLPADIADMDEQRLLEELLEQVKHQPANLSLSSQEKVARSLAKRASIKKGQILNEEEMVAVVERLFASSNPNFAPDGRKTLAMLTMDDLDRLFSD